MRLRSISLTNVRRFTDTVRISGVRDGLNILCEPNEFGKSTLFDALQAVFFKPHRANDKHIRTLRPQAGGAPEVAVEIERDDEIFTITKRWTANPVARIEGGGRLVAQFDEAEAWISQLIGGGDGGPSGLLWVRQGLTTLTEGSKKRQDVALGARRDLLSSVTGEVEAVTGGRRMDQALSQCQQELDALATPNGRPKTGGAWKEASGRVDELRALCDELTDRVVVLQRHLEERGRMRKELAELEDPEAISQRKERVAECTKELQIAQRHAATIESESHKVDAERLSMTNLQERRDRLRQDLKEQDKSTEALRSATRDAAAARQALAAAKDTQTKAQDDLDRARNDLQIAKEAFCISQRHQAAREGAERRKELMERIKKAETARSEMEAASADAAQGLDAESIRQLEDLATEVGKARAIRDHKATQFIMDYDDGAHGKVQRNGEDVPDQELIAIPNGATLVIEAVGRLKIHSGAGDTDDDLLKRAEKALQESLELFECATLDEARQSAAARELAERCRTEAAASFKSLAPKGVEDLRVKLASVPILDDGDGDVLAVQDAERLAMEAEKICLGADEAQTIAADRLSDARIESSRLDAAAEAARDRRDRAARSLKQHKGAKESDLSDDLTRAERALADAETCFADMKRDAPDVQAIETKLKRAQSAEDAVRNRIAHLKPDLATIEANITQSAGDSVEEDLAETREQLDAAEERLEQIRHEVAVLRKLQQVLGNARCEAHDRYFEPVARELKPLLRLLWSDAELVWDDTTLLPTALIRQGQEEPIDVLSGGTMEQISLLVRLAFARMLAKRGQNAPVILDDALVFTDDDRIELMFDALHQQAGDLQILVLSCRQRAFRSLGGNVLRLA